MVLETAQMLCTAHHHYAELAGLPTDYIPYRKCFYNHPSSIWTRQNKATYLWLWEYFLAINLEYKKRYNKIHKSFDVCYDVLQYLPIDIPDGQFTQPPQCMPDEFKTECSLEAYWNYYIGGKKHIPRKTELLHTVARIRKKIK